MVLLVPLGRTLYARVIPSYQAWRHGSAELATHGGPKVKLLIVLTAVLLAGMSFTAAAMRRTAAAGSGYRRWRNGLPADPGYFPIAVWLQDPSNARRFQAAGINLYVGLWKGPTEEQLAALKAAGMPVICEQNAVGLAHRSDPTIVGWMHGDEPDNAQEISDPTTGKRSYGGPVPPPRIVAECEKLRAADPTRPVMLNLGQGVANDAWVGRGPGASLDDYPAYLQGCDIVSFDVYPVAGIGKPDGANYLWYVAKGVQRLAGWSQGRRIIWNCLECTRISNETGKATPHQVRAEAWMSLIHGSTGLIWFVHQFKPQFDEHALLDDPEMLAAVTALNRQIHSLAPVLNSPTVKDGAVVLSSAPGCPIDGMVKRYGGATYLFAAGMRNLRARGSFAVRGVPNLATAEVIGENRRLAVRNGRFEDNFAPYDVHRYRIR
jgi:hypothetical protein